MGVQYIDLGVKRNMVRQTVQEAIKMSVVPQILVNAPKGESQQTLGSTKECGRDNTYLYVNFFPCLPMVTARFENEVCHIKT